MTPYRVFIAAEVVAALRQCRTNDRQAITRFIENLADAPFRQADYVEPDDVGRPIQVLIIGRYAICYWADHAVKEVKILDLKKAGS